MEHGHCQGEHSAFVGDAVGSGGLIEHFEGLGGVVVLGAVVEVQLVLAQAAVLDFYAPLGVDQQVVWGQSVMWNIVLGEM